MPKSDFDDLIREDERADLAAPRWSLFMISVFCCLIGASSVATPWILPFPASLVLGIALLGFGIALLVKFYKARQSR